MGFNHPITEEYIPIFSDQDAEQTMFRIVVKNNLTRDMASHLIESFEETFTLLDALDFSELHGVDSLALRHKDQRKISNHC